MDWIVKVKTRSNQIKDVKVYDYAYPDDAMEAALAQTAAVEAISCYPFQEEKESTSTSYNTQSDSYTPYTGKVIYGYEREFALYAILGLITIMTIPPIGFVIFAWMSYRAIKLNMEN